MADIVAEKGSKAAAAREFSKYTKVYKRTVAHWCKKKYTIVEMACPNKGKSRRRVEGAERKPLLATFQKALMEWIMERREKGLRVSRLLVMKKARVYLHEPFSSRILRREICVEKFA